uniref:Uncharacterized protein n=1 Tax=Anguilla anguilla TaxID=7936 RepID=A0A0E9QLG6_ANGAN
MSLFFSVILRSRVVHTNQFPPYWIFRHLNFPPWTGEHHTLSGPPRIGQDFMTI